MCDCYTAKCENCGCDMSLHIADFCTKRENVHPYCNRCSRQVKHPKAVKVFEVKITHVRQIQSTKPHQIGQRVVILCDDAKAYGIALN